MIFVTGPLYSGKREYIKQRMGWSEEQLEDHAIWDVQKCVSMCENAEEMTDMADFMAENFAVVIETETGGGVVPIDAKERRDREMAGRLGCLLAERADEVVRVFCGIPTILKTGEGTICRSGCSDTEQPNTTETNAIRGGWMPR